MKIIEQICNKVSIISNSEIVESGFVKDIFKNPKSAIARELILPMESFKINANVNKKYLRLVFDGTVDEPIISNLILSIKCELSILSSNVKIFDDKVYGQMIIQIPNDLEVSNKVIKYLVNKDILVEEVDGSGLDTNIRVD
jgi:D-methionine transport system ATP-binding protein